MDAADRELLTTTVEGALAGVNGTTEVDAALTGLGWLEMLETESSDAVAVVFTALGRTHRAASVLDDVVVAALGMTPRPDLAVLLPQFGTWLAPGHIGAERCVATGLATSRVANAREILVVCRTGLEVSAITVAGADAEIRPVTGIDPDAGFHLVRAERAVAVETRFDLGVWDAAVAAGRRAVAHQIAGSCRTMLDLARTHAIDRVQFGRPIASFQAVRHHLADALVAVEALDATLGAAADEPGPLTAALAKATAGRTARTVASRCQQVLAGIGFTTDHPFHHFLKRTMALEGLFGSTDEIAVELGRHLLDTRCVPTLIEL
jgi:hypothetical protein